jgi:dihydroorotase
MDEIDMTSTRCAQIIRLPRGTVAPGSVADVTIIDPDLKWKIDAEQFASKSRNCPFHGWDVVGRATHTIVGGKLKWHLS